MKYKFTLLDNARDSLEHAIDHLIESNSPNSRDLKYAIRDVAHAADLVLKEGLYRIHPAFVFEKPDDYPDTKKRTVGGEKALNRYEKLTGKKIGDKYSQNYKSCREMRNEIEHSKFVLHEQETKAIIGRMLSFIFYFSKYHLQVDLQKDFQDDDRWQDLLEMHHFWEAHGEEIQKRLTDQKIPSCRCPLCGLWTYNFDKSECELCGTNDQLDECDYCGKEYFSNELEYFTTVDGDESGTYEHEVKWCYSCQKEQEYCAGYDTDDDI